MSAIGIASRYTTVAASQTDSEVAGGDPIIVHGILCNNPHSAPQQFVFEEAGTSTAIVTINVPAGYSRFVGLAWIADKGIQVTTPGNGASATVWHSHPGR